MKKQSFVPRTDARRIVWLKNFSAKLGKYAKRYSIMEEELADQANSTEALKYWLDYQQESNQYNQKVNHYKDGLMNGIPAGAEKPVLPEVPAPPKETKVMPDVMGRAVSLGNRIKAHKDFTEDDGRDLGLVGAEVSLDPQAMKPALSIRLIGGGLPEIIWKKAGMDTLEIHKLDAATGNWKLLAIDSYPNYIDNAPLPAQRMAEVWQYRAIYRYHDAQVGEWSDAISVTVSGN